VEICKNGRKKPVVSCHLLEIVRDVHRFLRQFKAEVLKPEDAFYRWKVTPTLSGKVIFLSMTLKHQYAILLLL